MTQLERADLHAAIETRYPDNTTQDITPLRLRQGLHELVDSVFVTATDTGALPAVPLYQAGTPYTVGFLVRYAQPGAPEAFYYALNAGKLTAPGTTNTTDWKVVPGPTTATALSQSITLLQAQGIENTSVVAGRAYLVDFGPDGNGDTQTVAVRGVGNDCFDAVGTLEINGQRWGVENINVGAGTFTICYTNDDIQQLVASRQAKVAYLVNEYVLTPTYTLNITRLNKYVSVTTGSGLTTIKLPAVVPSDAGALIELYQAAGDVQRYVDTTGKLMAELRGPGALVRLRLVASGITTQWVVVGRSSEVVLPIKLAALRTLRKSNLLAPDTLYLVDDVWQGPFTGTVYLRALDVNQLAALGDVLNAATGQLESVVVDVDAGSYNNSVAPPVTALGYSYNLNLNLNQEQPDYYKKATSITDIVLPAGTGIASLELRLGSGSWSALALPLSTPIAVPAGTLLTWRVAQYALGFNTGMANIEVIF